MAFDNTEDSQHVYYLILPLHPTQVIYLSKKKRKHHESCKRALSRIAKTQAGPSNIKWFPATWGLLITNNVRPSFVKGADGIYMFLAVSWISDAL